MSELNCSGCGATLVPGAGFCRQCGAPVLQPETSEQPTAILNQAPDSSTTRRLDPRPTSPGYRDAAPSGSSKPPAGSGRLKIFLAGLIIVALFGLGSVVRSVLKTRRENQGSSQVSRALIYPGSRIVLDMGDQGGGVLQMGTSDALDKVQSWYVSNLKPTKIMQVTSGTVILRRDNVTATLVADNNSTTIVIKQSAP